MSRRGKKPQLIAHKQVAAVAREMAREYYAAIMESDNALYADWKAQCEDLTPQKCEDLFVELMFPKLLETARATLARCLADPTQMHLHEAIYDALTKDYPLAHIRRQQAEATAQGRRLLEVNDHGEVTSKRSPLN